MKKKIKKKKSSRNNYNQKKAQFHARTENKLPPETGNKNFLNRSTRNRRFKIKKFLPQFKNVQVKQRGRVVREMIVRHKTIYLGKPRVQCQLK